MGFRKLIRDPVCGGLRFRVSRGTDAGCQSAVVVLIRARAGKDASMVQLHQECARKELVVSQTKETPKCRPQCTIILIMLALIRFS